MMTKPTTHEVVVSVFQHESLFFKSIQEVIEWSDDAGVDYR